MTERDHEQLADELAEESKRLSRENEQLKGKIDDVRDDWRRKQQDPGVPGANPPAAADEDEPKGSAAAQEN